MSTLIDAAAVTEAFLDSLFREDELVGGAPTLTPIVAEGIVQKVGFMPERLATHRAAVAGWLANLPTQFQQAGGGGWSFLNACNDREDEQWTGEHRTMEQLFLLGIGLGLAKWQLPREMWDVLPGGMPYVVVDPYGTTP